MSVFSSQNVKFIPPIYQNRTTFASFMMATMLFSLILLPNYNKGADAQTSPSNCTPQPLSVYRASGSAPANPPSNAVDNNFNTMWSNPRNYWIIVDLGSTKTLCSLDISWYRGNLRQNDFNIRVWDTPSQQWKIVFSGKSSGTTAGPERYDFQDTGGRYVAIFVNGNTENNYASISEVEINARASSPQGTECTTGWFITGYYRAVESDFNSGQTTTITPDDGVTRTFDTEFLDSVRRNGAGKTNEGWYLKYWDGQYRVRELSSTWDGTPTQVGDIATDQGLIPTGTRGITVPTLPSPWNQQVFKASDIGPAITDKHIDVFTGEGSAARSETFRITSRDNTLCMPPLSVNDPPTAIYRDGYVLKTDENDPITITIRATDPEGDPSRFTIVNNPTSGTLSTITGYTTTTNTDTGISTTSAKVVYTPKSGFSGKDRFEYRANDGKENGEIAVVSITVG
jgi:3D (Asp-Asp-Asp) domain-containing protein